MNDEKLVLARRGEVGAVQGDLTWEVVAHTLCRLHFDHAERARESEGERERARESEGELGRAREREGERERAREGARERGSEGAGAGAGRGMSCPQG